MLKIFKIGFIVFLMPGYLLSCPVLNDVTVLSNGGGSYTFTMLLDYSGTNQALISDEAFTWSFPTGDVITSTNSVTYQFTENGTYNINIAYTSTYNDVIKGVCYIPTGYFGHVVNDVATCPIVAINLSQQCELGFTTFSATVCDQFNDWILDDISWNFGDGVTESSSLTTIVHEYNLPGPYEVTANVLFHSSVGNLQCETSVIALEDTTLNPCLLYDVPPPMSNFLEIDPFVFIPWIGFDQEYFCQNISIDFYSYYTWYPNNAPLSGLAYELLIDENSVYSGTGTPDPNTSIYSSILTPGEHVITIIYTYDNDCEKIASQLIVVDECDECESCNTFQPLPGSRYWLSAWVSEEQMNVMTYESTSIQLNFLGTVESSSFTPTGDIIDGWQRIVGDFVIPANTTDLEIKLINSSLSNDSYFDDIRIHPFNSSMKSYVYDPISLKLLAELDDNNYATFYEYDNEGQLIRIKKETSKGIMTIQESRSSNPK